MKLPYSTGPIMPRALRYSFDICKIGIKVIFSSAFGIYLEFR